MSTLAPRMCSFMTTAIIGTGVTRSATARQLAADGREGEAQTIGFYPRRGKITVYLMDGTVRYSVGDGLSCRGPPCQQQW